MTAWTPTTSAMGSGGSVEIGREAAHAHEHFMVFGVSMYTALLAIIGLSMVCTLWRLFRGPTLADRVVAVDLLAFFAAGAVAVLAVQFQRSQLLTVAIIVALLAFMGTVAFARYLERSGLEDDNG